MPIQRYSFRCFFVSVFTLCLCISISCENPVNEADKTTPKTIVRFINLEQFPVKIYSDSGYLLLFAEIEANGTKDVPVAPDPTGMAFYPIFDLSYPVGTPDIVGFINFSCHGPYFTVAVHADRINQAPVEKLKSIGTNSAYLMLINKSNVPILFSKSSQPVGGSSLINSGLNASYTITPGSSLGYAILLNGNGGYPVAFPADFTEFKLDIIYVFIFNGTNLVLSEEKSIRQMMLPPVPAGVKAVDQGSNCVTISWNGQSNVTGYKVYRDESRTGDFINCVSGPNPLTAIAFTDTGLVPTKEYFYKVSAIDGNGESEKSAVVSVR